MMDVLLVLCGYIVILGELMLAQAFFASHWWAVHTPLQRNMAIGLLFVFPPTYLYIVWIALIEKLLKKNPRIKKAYTYGISTR
jgi:hypothetical protein